MYSKIIIKQAYRRSLCLNLHCHNAIRKVKFTLPLTQKKSPLLIKFLDQPLPFSVLILEFYLFSTNIGSYKSLGTSQKKLLFLVSLSLLIREIILMERSRQNVKMNKY
jgi:hypothetical protein